VHSLKKLYSQGY